MDPVGLIAKKRDGGELTPEEISFLIGSYLEGRLPDYQMSALLMAIYLRGMTSRETYHLTEAMARSGALVEFEVDGFVADKHSTGGVGDKVSLVLVPLLASAGLAVGKLSGRGLGHTGGTIDKLESIPGFRGALSLKEFKAQVERWGLAISESTGELAPADHKLYALRDVTATVGSLPLIASSIMSKKLAVRSDGLVLDVKVGRGALMKTPEQARALAELMVELGRRAGRKVAAVLTGMDQPLGRAVGNALEVREAIETLQGRGPADLVEVCLALGAELLLMAGQAPSREEARGRLLRRLQDGTALEKFAELVARQGGDVRVISDLSRLPRARAVHELKAERAGYIMGLDALIIGEAARRLGAGRRLKGEEIDRAVGIVLLKKEGEPVEAGEPLAQVHYNSEGRLAEARPLLESAYLIGPEPPAPRPLILGRIA